MKVRGGRSILRDLGSIGLPERGRTRRVESAYSLNLRIVWGIAIGLPRIHRDFQDPCRNDEPDFAGSPIFIEVRRSCIHAIRP